MLEDLVVTLNIRRNFPCEAAAAPDPESVTREVDGPQVNPKETVTQLIIAVWGPLQANQK